MAKLSYAQVKAAAIAGGFTGAAADTIAAIAGAESGYNPSAVGDVSLETAKWGPSVGLVQIRTLKADTGTGSDRDISRLQGNVAAQMHAAYKISDGGRNFSAWSTYKNGSYLKFLNGNGSSSGTLTSTGSVATEQAGLFSGITQPLLAGTESLGYTLAFAALGLGLLGFGVVRTFPGLGSAASGALKLL